MVRSDAADQILGLRPVPNAAPRATIGGMSFDIHLQRFASGDAGRGGGDVAALTLSPLLEAPPVDGFARLSTGDGSADVYGIGSDHLMIGNASGHEVFDVIVAVAAAAEYVVMPVGCPTCLVDAAMTADLPPELRTEGEVVVVASGA